MKYYIYDTEEGYEEFDVLEEAALKFQNMNFKSRYTAFGITEGVSAVDIIFKQINDDDVQLKGSGDFLTSSLLQNKPKELMDEVIKSYRALKVPEYNLMCIIDAHDAENLEEESEEM